jgi:hypothetical protein
VSDRDWVAPGSEPRVFGGVSSRSGDLSKTPPQPAVAYTGPPPISIRRPLVSRIYSYVFIAGCVVFLANVVVQNGAPAGALTAVAIFLVPLLLVALTAHRLGVFTDGRELIVRGQFSTRRFDANEIEGFRVAAGGRSPGCINALLRDGRIVPLAQTSQLFWGVGAETLQRRCTELQDWLASINRR